VVGGRRRKKKKKTNKQTKVKGKKKKSYITWGAGCQIKKEERWMIVAQSERVWGIECVWEFEVSISLIKYSNTQSL
jgi:hypothetical protein